jgi:hypothetical protein
MNLRRRHLDESQRGMCSARLATMRQGSRTDLTPSANLPEVSQQYAAQLLNVSERTLRDAKKVAQFIAVCSAPILAEELPISSPFPSESREKRRVS